MEVLITREIPSVGIDKVKGRYDIEVNQEPRNLNKQELIEKVKGKDGLLCLLTDTIDEDVLEAGKGLKVVSNYAVGFDNIDVEEATKRGIAVTNTPGVLTEATAEMTFTLMLAVTRNVVKGDRFVRDDRFEGWDPMLLLGHELHGKTLGVVGMGNIGKKVAEISQGFDMDVIYYDQERKEDMEDKVDAKKVDIDTLMKKSDFVTLHVPLLDATEKMIGKRELELMKEDAYIVNAARGEVVDEDALVEVLEKEKIAGAGIDVYANEPHGANPDYYDLENVVLAPHLGSATHRAREGMAKKAATNLIDVLEGREPEHIVNPEVMDG